jgi:hypothetical protein
MTISSTARKAGPFSGTGVQTSFPFNFKVFAAGDLLVVQTDAAGIENTLVLNAQYTVVLNADQDDAPGGMVTMLSATPVGFLLTISSAIPLTQGLSIPNMGGFYPKVIEQALDKLTIAAQQTAEAVGRCLRFALSDNVDNATLPAASARAAKFLAFDATGNPTVSAGTGADAGLRSDLASPLAGTSLIGFIQAGVGAVLQSLRDVLRERVSITNFGAVAGALTPCADAVQAALNSGAGKVRVPKGRFLIEKPVTIPAGVELCGDGDESVLVQDPGWAATGDMLSATNVSSICIRDLRMENLNGTFAETIGLLSLNGVADALVEGCKFYGFRGDAIYLGSQITGPCQNIKIRKNVFDGVNNQNRQGVSIVNGEQITIANNAFRRCTKPGMPGAIDIEPNDGNAIVRNILIQNNVFSECGGNSVISVNVWKAALTNKLRDIKIKDNWLLDNTTGNAIRVSAPAETISDTLDPMGILIEGNDIEATGIANPLNLNCLRGVAIRKNTILNGGANYFGDATVTNVNLRDVLIEENTFRNGGDGGGFLRFASISRLTIRKNTFDNPQAGAAARALFFYGTGVTTTSDHVTIRENTFVKGAAQTVTAGTSLHTADSASNIVSDNIIVGGTLANGLPAALSVDGLSLTATALGFAFGGSALNPHVYNAAYYYGSVQQTALNGSAVWQIIANGTGTPTLSFGTESVRRGVIDAPNGSIRFSTNPTNTGTAVTTRLTLDNSGHLYSGVDNAQNNGIPAFRWAQVYAGTATINTSDEREKEQIGPIDPALLRAWAKVEWLQFKFTDAVQAKGADARWHIGAMAQRIKTAFESEGLDAFAYGLLCYDEWPVQYEPVMAERPVLDAEGSPVLNDDGTPKVETYDTGEQRLVLAAGNRYGVRYEEALALECAHLRSRLGA